MFCNWGKSMLAAVTWRMSSRGAQRAASCSAVSGERAAHLAGHGHILFPPFVGLVFVVCWFFLLQVDKLQLRDSHWICCASKPPSHSNRIQIKELFSQTSHFTQHRLHVVFVFLWRLCASCCRTGGAWSARQSVDKKLIHQRFWTSVKQ